MSRNQRSKKRTDKKRTRPRSRWQRILLRFGWILPIAAIFVAIGVLMTIYAFAEIKLPRDIEVTSSAEVYDSEGRLIGVYANEVRRFLLTRREFSRLPDHITEAVLSAEDRGFYDHNGVSFRGIVRAAWANFAGGEIQQGGSTITQQYVKNAVLQDPERTISRKVKEAILAIKLERRYSKNQILHFYLDTIYLGRGAYGIEAAARAYFDKHANELTLRESAFLASLIPSPEAYQPDEKPRVARQRRNRVIDLMRQQGYIGRRQARAAKRTEIKARPNVQTDRNQQAAYFMEWLRRRLEREYGQQLYAGGLKIYTTLNLDLQRAAESAVDSVLNLPEDPQAALVSMSARGHVRAIVGGRGHYTNVKKARGFNYATDFPGRQPGSSAKPFTLLTAVQEGISPQSRFSGSSPKEIDECAGENGIPPWEVDNYGGSSYGTITLDEATTNSVNTVYAQLIAEVGPAKVGRNLEAFGFGRDGAARRDFESHGCSMALGSWDATPLEQARAYAGFAARGVLPEVTPVLYVTDSEGNCIREYVSTRHDCEEEFESDAERVSDQNAVDVLTQSLTHVVQSGTGTAANLGRPVAGKTGTSQENRDAWFAGYVPQMSTVVWVGYPFERGDPKDPDDDFVPQMQYCGDPVRCRPVHGQDVTGGQFAAPIWAAYMEVATAAMEPLPFAIPEDLPDRIINSPPPPPPPPPTTPAPKPSKPPPVTASPTPPPVTATPTPPTPTESPPPTVDPGGAAGTGGGGSGPQRPP